MAIKPIDQATLASIGGQAQSEAVGRFQQSMNSLYQMGASMAAQEEEARTGRLQRTLMNQQITQGKADAERAALANQRRGAFIKAAPDPTSFIRSADARRAALAAIANDAPGMAKVYNAQADKLADIEKAAKKAAGSQKATLEASGTIAKNITARITAEEQKEGAPDYSESLTPEAAQTMASDVRSLAQKANPLGFTKGEIENLYAKEYKNIYEEKDKASMTGWFDPKVDPDEVKRRVQNNITEKYVKNTVHKKFNTSPEEIEAKAKQMGKSVETIYKHLMNLAVQ